MDDLMLLHQKIDYLTEQLDAQRKRQEKWDELYRDMTPIASDLMNLTIAELDDVGRDFELADILFLFKRLLRDVRMLTAMLEQMESMAELAGEMRHISRPAVDHLIDTLQSLEQKGYFTFFEGLTFIVDQIVTEFDEEDVKALGENVVTILKTVRSMTQPEIMALANDAIQRMEEPVEEDISTWALVRELRDPQVRRGFARLLNVVKALSAQPDTGTQTGIHNS